VLALLVTIIAMVFALASEWAGFDVSPGHVIGPEASREGFDPALFGDWIDADGDGCDTRQEVLIRDATVAPTVGADCALWGGEWRTRYASAQFAGDGGAVRIDHLVPLVEAWESGAHAWSPARRNAFYNDLDAPALIAAWAGSIEAKNGADPAQWLPPVLGRHCWYAQSWLDIKRKWGLTFDPAEWAAITLILDKCED
jgi:hypothetical protein